MPKAARKKYYARNKCFPSGMWSDIDEMNKKIPPNLRKEFGEMIENMVTGAEDWMNLFNQERRRK